MDTQTALKIMELTSSADLEDLREAFRRLAKQHHPDRVKYSTASDAAEDRMKEINLAFNLLKQELNPVPRSKETADIEPSASSSDERGQSDFFSFVRNWKKSFSQKRENSHTRTEKKERPVCGGACANRPRRRAAEARRKRSFQRVFRQSFREAVRNETGAPGRGRGCRDRTVYNYSTYMKLKKKMTSPVRRRDADPGPVGPVSRISKIKRVKK